MAFELPTLRRRDADHRFPGRLTLPTALETLPMNDQSPSNETYSPAETEARREAALRYALSTPPKPHKAMRKRPRESSQSK